jgi:hypothetical protein
MQSPPTEGGCAFPWHLLTLVDIGEYANGPRIWGMKKHVLTDDGEIPYCMGKRIALHHFACTQSALQGMRCQVKSQNSPPTSQI